MNQEEKEDLKRAGKSLSAAAELAGEAVMLLGITGSMVEVDQVEVAMLQFGNIDAKIGYILDGMAEGEKGGGHFNTRIMCKTL